MPRVRIGTRFPEALTFNLRFRLTTERYALLYSRGVAGGRAGYFYGKVVVA